MITAAAAAGAWDVCEWRRWQGREVTAGDGARLAAAAVVICDDVPMFWCPVAYWTAKRCRPRGEPRERDTDDVTATTNVARAMGWWPLPAIRGGVVFLLGGTGGYGAPTGATVADSRAPAIYNRCLSVIGFSRARERARDAVPSVSVRARVLHPTPGAFSRRRGCGTTHTHTFSRGSRFPRPPPPPGTHVLWWGRTRPTAADFYRRAVSLYRAARSVIAPPPPQPPVPRRVTRTFLRPSRTHTHTLRWTAKSLAASDPPAVPAGA